MTYMGQPYYPRWLDNLAEDVTLEAAAMDGTAHGAADVRSIVVTAKELYDNQQFSYAGPFGDNEGFLEIYTTEVRGVPVAVNVVVTFNAAGQTHHITVNHRPRSALLFVARVLREKFAGTPLVKHWESTP
ncbi:hypothetical protein [Mycobacterium sp. EPa45]|uniref:hypothetical protein n=1 Tax=Mycobacterium sp. EPa45 TaxID=1545728 RepID=UPI000AF45790|nr:hypothetical protein [Mycobacterium sp. EPa45]